ncbi:carbohydrate ABC transporter permease [Faecalicatena orotica]|uniref:Carbohydrate ABC transporter membrane protein 2 (CUT1 family) n=1 Tax=Faecalicatena orotica TaxID=1544 RepID=A0A2Y9BHS1_9FIRM|nr:carbohydrate ABC transporter permease [Faecalicatena orotica]PWJ23643.1 carbohydrate ABC transporter membrane protein 2 (CUT1 family) [Faecalicatena orotica]SSA57555.1 carbohydrate ABC transporter membrane protein 2, CUT1 family [Faecalicatena orotica]
MKRKRGGGTASQLLMILLVVIIIFPLYFMTVNSFKTHEEYVNNMIGVPRTFTLQNYVEAFQGKPFGQWFFNSLILTLAAALVTGAIALLAGYAFAKMKFKGRELLFGMIVPLMSVPPVAMIIPQFRIIKIMGLVNTRVSVILIYVGIMLPMTVYLMRNFMKTVPDSLLDAAKIDGCNSRKALLFIMVPLSVPALITSSLVNIVWVWNELLISLVFLQKESLRTLMVGITLFKGRFTLNIPVIMAGLVIATVPIVVIYIFAQKYLVEGMLAGSVKE